MFCNHFVLLASEYTTYEIDLAATRSIYPCPVSSLQCPVSKSGCSRRSFLSMYVVYSRPKYFFDIIASQKHWNRNMDESPPRRDEGSEKSAFTGQGYVLPPLSFFRPYPFHPHIFVVGVYPTFSDNHALSFPLLLCGNDSGTTDTSQHIHAVSLYFSKNSHSSSVNFMLLQIVCLSRLAACLCCGKKY